MKTVKRVLMCIAVLVVVFIGHVAISAYFPCTYYPRVYWQALSVDHKFQSFQSKHGRLPDMLDSRDVGALGLDKGHFMTFRRERNFYVVEVTPTSLRDYVYTVEDAEVGGGNDVAQLRHLSFDGPWVRYSSMDRSIKCVHR